MSSSELAIQFAEAANNTTTVAEPAIDLQFIAIFLALVVTTYIWGVIRNA